MKNIIKILAICLLIVSCEDTESPTFDAVGGQTGVGFGVRTQSLNVPVNDTIVAIPVYSTTLSSSERSYGVTIDTTNLAASAYSLGSVVIPANSHLGSLDVTLVYDELVDFQQNILVLALDLPDGTIALAAGNNATGNTKLTTLNFVREFDASEYVCTNLTLDIVTDAFGSETSYEIVDGDGVVVNSGGPLADGTGGQTSTFEFTLPGGCYTFTIFDSYGDGLFDGNITGTYKLSCQIVTLAEGAGNFGDSQSTDFCIIE